MNASNVLSKLQKDEIIKYGASVNRVIPEVVEKYGDIYKNEKVCYEIDVSILGMAWRLPIKRLIFYNFFAESTKENFEYYLSEFMKINDKYFEENLNSNVPITIIIDKILDEISSHFRDYLLPLMFLGVVKGYNEIRKLFEETIKTNPELNEDLNNLTKSLPFVTIKMGLELYDLTKYFNKDEYKGKTVDDFYNDYISKKFQEKFYTDFNLFMKKYGFRGDGEFDIKNPRYNDNPKSIIGQIFSSLLGTNENNNPHKD